jgi:hypothetical protein
MADPPRQCSYTPPSPQQTEEIIVRATGARSARTDRKIGRAWPRDVTIEAPKVVNARYPSRGS